MKSQYLSSEQLRDLVYNRLPGLGDSAGSTDEHALILSPAQWGEAVDAVIAAYVATLPDAPEKLVAELHLLEEVCAFYANDEDRYLAGDGEPFGSIPTEVGLKARSARERFNQREVAEAARIAALWPKKVELTDAVQPPGGPEERGVPEEVLYAQAEANDAQTFCHIFAVVPVTVAADKEPEVDIRDFYVRARSLERAYQLVLDHSAYARGATQLWGAEVWETPGERVLMFPKIATARPTLAEHEHWTRVQEHYVLLWDGSTSSAV
jgi:hypothetical protein